ncbi:hypothetical protein [Pseudanabaena sp. PCC 6802]|uniref:hypothetical protein n=1 Tax=Pseudanabaena sp. PCC 6802 TaxID=118173 RepID=UPI000344C355|nr:hypothetical protein [Pseudanabaena sp. PCC 6802]
MRSVKKELNDKLQELAEDLQPVKISVTLSGEEYAILQRLASKQGIKAADALRKAIVTEDFIKSQIRAGKKIMIKNTDSSIQEVIFF